MDNSVDAEIRRILLENTGLKTALYESFADLHAMLDKSAELTKKAKSEYYRSFGEVSSDGGRENGFVGTEQFTDGTASIQDSQKGAK